MVDLVSTFADVDRDGLVTVVVEVVVFGILGLLLMVWDHGSACFFDGLLNDSCTSFTLCNAVVLGIRTTVAVDLSHGRHVFGDVDDVVPAVLIWFRLERATALSGGFACLLYSRLCDGRGGGDPRAPWLPTLLRLAHWLLVKLVMLASLAPAKLDPLVSRPITHSVAFNGLSLAVAVLDLQNVWPPWRQRAWRLFCDPCCGLPGPCAWSPAVNGSMVKGLSISIARWYPRDALHLICCLLTERPCEEFE